MGRHRVPVPRPKNWTGRKRTYDRKNAVDNMRAHLAGKPVGSPVWGESWVDRAADMLRIDPNAAGIAYAVPRPDGPQYADFHGLRHTYLTLGGRSGIDLLTLQKLAARYSYRRQADLTGAVGETAGAGADHLTRCSAGRSEQGHFVALGGTDRRSRHRPG